MTTGKGDSSGKTGDDGPPLFRATQPRPRRGPVVALVVVAGGLAVAFAVRSLRPAPARPVSSAPAAPAPPPLPPDAADEPMMAIAGGTFSMGSVDGDPDEQPITQVTVAPFLLDRYEVTVRAYRRCVARGKCTAPDTGMYCNWQKQGLDDHPVNCVAFNQAVAYCAFAGKRLPTEEEWEYAARGVEGRKYPWKDGPPGPQLCWNGGGSDLGKGNRQGTCRVGSYPAGASWSGVLDLAGNVWEWTDSPYCGYGRRGCGNDERVIRGGSWSNVDPAYVRAQDRAKETQKATPDNVGLRCAKGPS